MKKILLIASLAAASSAFGEVIKEDKKLDDKLEQNQVIESREDFFTDIDMQFNKLWNRRFDFGNDFTYRSSNRVYSEITDKQYNIKIEIPGYDKDQLKLEVQNQYLILSTKNSSVESKNDAANLEAKSFKQVLSLSNDVDKSGISANLKNGIIHIILPRIQTKDKDKKEIPIN